MAQDVHRLLLQTGQQLYNGQQQKAFFCHGIWVWNPETLPGVSIHTFDRILERLDFIRVFFQFYLLFPLSWQSALSLVAAFSLFF